MTYPSVYPTGTTIYDPERCWSGYTLFQAKEVGALLIDMNGTEVKLWKGLHGFPNKILPGGYVMGHTGERPNAFSMQDQIDLVQVDFNGKIVWKFNQWEFIEDPGEEPQWMARQHHDWDHQIVWEYISPYWGSLMHMNMLYRAYRVPYEWVPQLIRPREVPIERIDVTTFRVPGASPPGPRQITAVEGVRPYQGDAALCVVVDLKK